MVDLIFVVLTSIRLGIHTPKQKDAFVFPKIKARPQKFNQVKIFIYWHVFLHRNSKRRVSIILQSLPTLNSYLWLFYRLLEQISNCGSLELDKTCLTLLPLVTTCGVVMGLAIQQQYMNLHILVVCLIVHFVYDNNALINLVSSNFGLFIIATYQSSMPSSIFDLHIYALGLISSFLFTLLLSSFLLFHHS